MNSNYSEMVSSAITALKNRKGSSKYAILKYIVANYEVDKAHASTLVNTTLKRGVKEDVLHQVTGTGANGLFKLKESMPSPTKSHNLSNKKVTQGQLIFNQIGKDSSTIKGSSAKEDINLLHQGTLLNTLFQYLLNPSTTPEMALKAFCLFPKAIGSETNKDIETCLAIVRCILNPHITPGIC